MEDFEAEDAALDQSRPMELLIETNHQISNVASYLSTVLFFSTCTIDFQCNELAQYIIHYLSNISFVFKI